MHKIFTLYTRHNPFQSGLLSGRNLKYEEGMSSQSQKVMKTLPSTYSLSLIMGYAAALQVVKTHEGFRFDLIAN
jgi:hypothetical protein